MTEDQKKNTPPEFSVRQSWNGKLILRIRTYEILPYSGMWTDAGTRDLPTFFDYMLRGRPTK
jgi:hypothetical protein